MATIESHDVRTTGPRMQEDSGADVAAGITMGEAAGGLATLILAIIGLASLATAYPAFLASICAIVLGAALVAEGGATLARFSRAMQDMSGEADVEMGGGTTAEFVGGAAGIVLGILALIGLVPWVLTSVAVIVFGASLILGASTASQVSTMSFHHRFAGAGHESQRRVFTEMASATGSAKLMIGLASIILGILAVTGVASTVLTLVAFLCLGAAVTLSGACISSKMVSFMHGR